MAPTFVINHVDSGAETSTNVLNGTPVEKAGASGVVYAAFHSTLATTTATLKGRRSGKEIIPRGCAPSGWQTAAGEIDAQDFLFMGQVDPGEELDLEIISAAASSHRIAVRT